MIVQFAFISPALVEYKDDDLVQSTGGDICIEKGYVNLKIIKFQEENYLPLLRAIISVVPVCYSELKF